jgi:hypothetical protein
VPTRFVAELIKQVLLGFKVLAEFVERLAPFGFFWRTGKDEVDENSVNDGQVLQEATFELKKELVLFADLGGASKDPIHAGAYKALERFFEKTRGGGPLKLKEIEVTAVSVDVETVDSVVIPAKSYLGGSFVALEFKFVLKVQQCEIVFADAPVNSLEIRVCLSNLTISDYHVLTPSTMKPHRAFAAPGAWLCPHSRGSTHISSALAESPPPY